MGNPKILCPVFSSGRVGMPAEPIAPPVWHGEHFELIILRRKNMKLIIKEIHAAVMEGDSGTAQEKVEAGMPVAETLNGMIAAMAEVGKLFEAGEYFVPKMLISAGDIR